MPSNANSRHEEYRNKLLGLGESSLRKNYYPQLRKHMRELEESRIRYETIFNATADGMIIHDAETFDIFEVNYRALQMFGYTTDELKMSGYHILSCHEEPYTPENAIKYLKKALVSEVHNIEWLFKRKDGKNLWGDVSLKYAVIGGRNCVIASVRDISSRKLLEEKLLHSQKMEAIGQLAGGVAHDFNNMLSGIIGAAELINTMSDVKAEVRDLADIILKAANTAGNLTTQLLSFSRKGNFEESEIHIHQAIRNATEILQRSIERNIEVILELEADKDTVRGNLALIENLVINMSLNSRDAMPEGGKLIIHTDNRMHTSLNSTVTAGTGLTEFICIMIIDTGQGMDRKVRQHIFEPFYTTKGTGKGTGLGLAAVYGAVQRHKGTIEVESAPGHGTTFKIYLPLITSNSEIHREESDLKERGTGRILLIDDEHILRFIGKKMLSDLGYEVVTAEDGLQGIAEFKKERPDLVLLDMVMPNMNSTDCFRELKKIDSAVPIVAVSGFTVDSTIDNLFTEGLAGFVEKPYKAKQLSQKIANTIRDFEGKFAAGKESFEK